MYAIKSRVRVRDRKRYTFMYEHRKTEERGDRERDKMDSAQGTVDWRQLHEPRT